jgi:hypothetical protein
VAWRCEKRKVKDQPSHEKDPVKSTTPGFTSSDRIPDSAAKGRSGRGDPFD